MPPIPAPSPLTDHRNLEDAPEPTQIRSLHNFPEVTPPTDFELEVRERLANIESKLVRNDSLIMQAMVDTRTQIRKATEILKGEIDSLKSLIGPLASDLQKLVGNGHE